MKSRFLIAAAAIVVLAGCAATDSTEGEPSDDDILVVASTNVYGDIAGSIGGDAVSVTSIISSAAQDPHSFEASAQDQLAISKADLVVRNGGGYDPFIETLLAGSGSNAAVITATELGEHDHESENPANETAEPDDTEPDDAEHAEHGHDEHAHDHSANEHVWYDLHVMRELAHELAHVLAELDPAQADAFHERFEQFAAGIDQLEADVAAIDFEAAGAVVTEPVALFLLEDAGLDNLTPSEFTEAIEEGGDVPPRALLETLDLFAGAGAGTGAVAVLAYNEQTASAETERVRDAAADAGVPIVSFTETLPEGEDYLSWMTANVESLAQASER